MIGRGSWSAMATGCINIGSQPGKPAWLISSGLPAAWRNGRTLTWRPVAPGHWRSCNGYVIWRRARLLVGSGGRGSDGGGEDFSFLTEVRPGQEEGSGHPAGER